MHCAVWALVFVTVGSRGAFAPLSSESLACSTLVSALRYLELEPLHLDFEKRYAEDDTFRLAVVDRILSHPLAIVAFQDTVRTRVCQDVQSGAWGDLLGVLGAWIQAPLKPVRPPSRTRGDAGPRVDDPVSRFVGRAMSAQRLLDQAFEGLSAGDRALVAGAALTMWGDEDDAEDSARRERFLGRDSAFSEGLHDKVLDLAKAVEGPLITQAAVWFLEAVEELREAVVGEGVAAGWQPTHLPGVGGAVLGRWETPWGWLMVGSSDPNVYGAEVLRETAFLIDLGGDDCYRGPVACARGDEHRGLAALVDLAGNDYYEARAPFSLGAAVLGVSVLWDEAGDDTYRGDDGSCGAGFFGVGFMYEGGGRDVFQGRNFTQGAGAFGMGALVSTAHDPAPPGPEVLPDRAFAQGLVPVPATGSTPIRYDDNDTYLAARYAQGFGSTFGVGLLFDGVGSDVYHAGGRYLHRPLLSSDFQSLSQGFSIGFRPRAAGGLGILLDCEGNDVYAGGVYAQGVGYWYSMGLLIDGGGNDRYMAVQYAQGAGVHLAVGSLWDRGGDDQYVSKFGVTQGTGHDLSVGILLDEAGNDSYTVSDGQGVSIANSVGLFVDAQGDDLYATRGMGQGAHTWARGFCGVGVFLDLEGDDSYPRYEADSLSWSSDLFAVGVDLPRDVRLPEEEIPEPVLTAEDSARSVEELFKTASMWEVGSAREKVRRARAALLAKGEEALDYAIGFKLGTSDGLEYRTLEELAKAFPDSFARRILPRVRDPDAQTRRNVIGLLGTLKRREAREPLERMLRDKAFQADWPRIISALGTIGDPASIPSLRPFLGDAVERRRLQAVVSLGALKDSLSLPHMVGLLADPCATVRAAAAKALEGFGPSSLPSLLQAVQGEIPGRGVLALRVLGSVASSIPDTASAWAITARGRARRTLLQVLDSAFPSDPALRASAVEALCRFPDASTFGELKARMRDETDPMVRSAFRRQCLIRALQP